MQERPMATIRMIDNISPIKGADKIELAHVGGWQVVVRKDEYKIGDLAVYCEIDSWIPHSIAPFLTKDGHYPKIYNEVEGQRLKTVKLRGEISQGLLLSMQLLDTIKIDRAGAWCENDDVSEHLGIQKWEKPLAACLAGVARGNFPTAVPKTNQERIQNITRSIPEYIANSYTFEITEKVHGSSGTFYLDVDGLFHVCSRNLDLKETETNSFWKIARHFNIEQKMRDLDMFGMAIQGEVIGEGINGNQYGVTLDFLVFDMYDVMQAKYLSSEERWSKTQVLGLNHVPYIGQLKFSDYFGYSVEDVTSSILSLSEGQSRINESECEGFVFKCNEDPSISFKAVSNKWLLNGGEDQ